MSTTKRARITRRKKTKRTMRTPMFRSNWCIFWFHRILQTSLSIPSPPGPPTRRGRSERPHPHVHGHQRRSGVRERVSTRASCNGSNVFGLAVGSRAAQVHVKGLSPLCNVIFARSELDGCSPVAAPKRISITILSTKTRHYNLALHTASTSSSECPSSFKILFA
jgi:hypothetical protein